MKKKLTCRGFKGIYLLILFGLVPFNFWFQSGKEYTIGKDHQRKTNLSILQEFCHWRMKKYFLFTFSLFVRTSSTGATSIAGT